MQFAHLGRRDMVADCGPQLMTSDTGAKLLGATDDLIGLIDRSACFPDGREAVRLMHDVATLTARGYRAMS